MQKILSFSKRFFSAGIMLAVLFLASLLPAQAMESQELILSQGGERTLNFNIAGYQQEDLYLSELPPGITAEIISGNTNKEASIKLKASPDAGPGIFSFSLNDRVTAQAVTIVSIRITTGLKIDILPSDIHKGNDLKYILLLKDLGDHPQVLSFKAELTVTDPLKFSPNGQNWFKEGCITFENGVGEIFLTPIDLVVQGQGQLQIKNEELGLDATITPKNLVSTAGPESGTKTAATGGFSIMGVDGPNNSPETAIQILPGQQISTSIDYRDDQDWYKITVDHTCSLVFTMSNNSGGAYFEVFDSSLQRLTGFTKWTGTTMHGWKVNSGTYYVKISNYLSIDYSVSSITIRLDIREEDQWENNDVPERAVEIMSGQVLTGIAIEAINDFDWFKVSVDRTCSLVPTITSQNGYLWYDLYDASLNKIAGSYYIFNGTYMNGWKVAPGDYYLRISHCDMVNFLTSNVALKFDIREEDPWENNDVSERALELSSGQVLAGVGMEAQNDNDWFKVSVDHTCSLVATITNNSGNIYYTLYDSSLNALTGPHLMAKGTYVLGWKVPPGEYYMRLYNKASTNYLLSDITFKFNIREEDQWENNDIPERAVTITSGQVLTGIAIEAGNDNDWFKVSVDHTCSLIATITNNSEYIYYTLYDASLNKIYGPHNLSSYTYMFGWKVAPGEYYLRLSNDYKVDHVISNINLKFDIREEDQWENNDVPERATELTPGQQLTGIAIEAANDIDWFKVNVDHTGNLMVAISNNSGVVYYELYDGSLKKIGGPFYATGTYTHKVIPGLYYIKLYNSSANFLISNMTLKATLQNDYAFLTTLAERFFSFLCQDPVNAATGNYTFSQTDLNIPAVGIPLEFSRFYNSMDGYRGPLGRGWQHNYNSFLTVNEDSSISVLYPDGHMSLFTYSNGVYNRQAGSFEILTRNTDGTYTLKFKDQTSFIYSDQGKLMRISNKNDNAITLQYNGPLLSTVYDPAGRPLQFEYDQDSRLIQVTDPAGRTLGFTYDAAGNLLTVRDLNGEITVHAYDNKGLVSITDSNGNIVIKNKYDSNSRVIEQEDGKGDKTTYTYDTANRKSTVTDPRGHTATFYYDDKYRITKIAYPQNITTQYTYDANYNRLTETNKNGKTTGYSYDGMGNLLTVTGPAPLNYLTSYTYNSFNSPTRVVDPAGYATDYSYDEKGNLLTVSRTVSGGTAVTSFDYNQYGQITGITNANGKTTTIGYDQYGNQSSVADPLGNATTYSYDIVGRRLTITDPRGNLPGVDPAQFIWTYTYDAAGNVLTETDPMGNITTHIYDPKGNRLSTTDPRGNKTTFTFDRNNRLLTATDHLNNTTAYGYDASGNRNSVTDPLNNTTTYGYDFLERLISDIDPSGKTESYTLDGNGNMLVKTDRRGNNTSYEYDVMNRLTKITDALGNTLITEYDPLGNKISVKDQRNNTARFVYDQGSRLLSATDPLDRTTRYTYDLAGNRLSATDPQGATWTYTYDDANRLIKVTDPLGHFSITEYDSVGNAVYRTDANNVTTGFEYDYLSRLVSVTDALGQSTGYTYDQNGNLTAVTDARGKVSTIQYDALNRPVRESDPLGHAIQREYDLAGRLVSKTRPDSTVIGYSYDTNNRLTGISYPDGTGVTYTYDENGNRTSMSDPGGATGYVYDMLNRLASVTRGVDSTGYSYDPAGNITGITYPGGLQVNYSYNALNLPVSVSDAVYSAAIQYDETGKRLKETLPNGVVVDYTYDLSGRLTGLNHTLGENVMAGVAYTLDSAGNHLTATDEQGRTTNYTYDNLYQLTKVEYPGGEVVEYDYDPAGNRIKENGVIYSYDDANRLIQAGNIPYGYDLNGNLLSVGEAVYYSYDCENRLISYTDTNKTVQYAYDGDGIRTGMSVSGAVYGATEYIYDINAGLPLLLVEKDNSGNQNNYIYAGRLLSRIGHEGQVFYHQDGLGSISVVSDVYGNSLNRYTYDAFGSPRSVSENVNNPFMFTGEPYDPSDLLYLRARYYDPVTGRFLTQDTYPGEITDPLSRNRYAYCGNNPIVYIDPSGHLTLCEGENTYSDSIYLRHKLTEGDFILFSVLVYNPNVKFRDSNGNIYWYDAESNEIYYQYEALKDQKGNILHLFATSVLPTAAAERGLIMLSEGAGKAVKYGPMLKGPLPDAVANTFRSGTYTQIVTQEEITLYRAYGGKAGELGSYWTRTRPQGPLQTTINSALDQNWGNTATNIAEIRVPSGTTIYEGYAAGQRGLVGGGNQIYIEKVDPSWLIH